MNCENCYCIYEENGKCILDRVELDITGSCTECIAVNIDDGLLKALKRATLESLEE